MGTVAERLSQEWEEVWRVERSRLLSILIDEFGDITLAEDALQEAFVSALQWKSEEEMPSSPAAWLLTVSRRNVVDRLRRRKTRNDKHEEVDHHERHRLETANMDETMPLPDDRLKLMFTCCHPALAPNARVALTLKTLGGLEVDDIARAFLVKPTTLGQRLVRAKQKIHDAGIPYRVPPDDLLKERLSGVLAVLYLVYNQGYSSGAEARPFENDAIDLTRILISLMPDEPEPKGLLALMLYASSRRSSRCNEEGVTIPLDEQNRSTWDHDMISEARDWLMQARASNDIGPYQIQAGIHGIHGESPTADETDWKAIFLLYTSLYEQVPSPVVALNRAVALSRVQDARGGAENALRLLRPLEDASVFKSYQPYFATLADLHARAGNHELAVENYREAIALTTYDPDRRFLEGKLDCLVTNN